MMRLKSLSFKENFHRNDTNPWELEKLSIGERTLIVGKNATGKTRITNVIHNIARLINNPQIFNTQWNGEWIASFTDEHENAFEYSLSCENGRITNEQILISGEKKLVRSLSSVQIYSEKDSGLQKISPPNDRLVLHVRRDQNEFPFLESLISWANGVRGFSFANTSPNLIEIPGNLFQLTSLNAVPSALEKLSEQQLHNVLKKLEYMGYFLETASTGLVEGFPPYMKIIFLKEKGISQALKQFDISQGMFRAFSMLTIIEYLSSHHDIGTILVDDFGEGLDFERSKKLAELIFKEKTGSKVQFIATSNDPFLMNVVPLTDLTICFRSTHIVKCLNYLNSKEKFDEWQQLGLNNFDLFSSNYLLSQ